MGRRKVVEIQCDRCGRTETQNESEVSTEEVPELHLVWAGAPTNFQDLCRRCRETVKNYVQRILLEVEEKKESKPHPSGASQTYLASVSK